MSPVIDFTAVKDFEPIPAAEYQAALTKFEFGIAESSGQPKVKVQYTVTDGDHEGRIVFKDYSLQPKALWVIKKHLLALGADPDDFGEQTDLEEIMAGLVGSEAQIKVSQSEYPEGSGRYNNKLDDVKESNVLGAVR